MRFSESCAVMGLADRQYMRSPSHRGGRGVSFSAKHVLFALIAVNAAVFFLIPVGSRVWLYEFALSSIGIEQLKVWQCVSYMFLHADLMHLLLNMWGLYLFGTTVLPTLGTARFLKLYFLSGVSGALLWLVFNWHSNVPIVGASGAVCGVLTAAAMIAPQMRIQLLFPPIPMSMKTFVLMYAGLEIVGELSNSRGGIAHLAHLGGLVGAYWYLKYLYGNRVWDIFQIFRAFLPKRQAGRKNAPPPERSKVPEGWSVYSNPGKRPPLVSKQEVDRILDKISESGMHSLTQEELETLKRASEETTRKKR